jgi:hypothetical protein
MASELLSRIALAFGVGLLIGRERAAAFLSYSIVVADGAT